MRVAELEWWLRHYGWEQEPNRTGSGRAWTHPLFRERLTYHDPHGRDRRELRPDVVARILEDLERMTPRYEQTEKEAS